MIISFRSWSIYEAIQSLKECPLHLDHSKAVSASFFWIYAVRVSIQSQLALG